MQEGILLFYLPCNPSMEQELKKKKKNQKNRRGALWLNVIVMVFFLTHELQEAKLFLQPVWNSP